MITLNIDLTTASERPPFDPENIDETISIFEFGSFNDVCLYLLDNLPDNKSKVYVLAYGSDEDGVVYVDHCEVNVIENIRTQAQTMSDNSAEYNLFLFAYENYNDAYDLACDMKEQTGMLKWQIEEEKNQVPTIANGGISVNSLSQN
jgi:hypothetical protein